MFRLFTIISISTISCCDANNNMFHEMFRRAKANLPSVPHQPLFPPSSLPPSATSAAAAAAAAATGTIGSTGVEGKIIGAGTATAPVKVNQVVKDLSSQGNHILSCIHKRSRKIKLGALNKNNNNLSLPQLRLPPLLRQSRKKLFMLQRQVLIAIPTSLSSLSSELKNSFVESNIQNIELPFSGRGGSTVGKRRGRRMGMNGGEETSWDASSTQIKKKKRKNNTGFYYGIQDDVFFPKNESNNSNEGEKVGNGESSDFGTQREKGENPFQRPKLENESISSPSSSTLGDIMGETLLELREMREDIMALREEMHYMKEEIRRNNKMRSQHLEDDSDAEEYESQDIYGEERDELGQRRQPQMRSLTESMMRQQEFDNISKDVEKWAHRLLFEEDGEEDGWKEVMCNKMVRKKFNRDGSTKCYLKWMKDSRNFSEISSSVDKKKDDAEYPCIKCYSTINAPIENVCDYLSREANMPEYNDLVIAYKDLEDVSPQGKICWSQCPQILFIKPRDFVTFCHHRWRKDGTQIVVNQACEHEKAPGNEEESEGKICRAHALRGANFIMKDPDDPNKTRIAILAHANPGGGIPQWAMKTAVNAVAPIEPFKLFHRIDARVCAFSGNNEQKADMVNSFPQNSGRHKKPAGLSQLGYACFWPIDGHKSGEFEYSSQQINHAHGEHTRNEYIRREIGLEEQEGKIHAFD